MGRGERAGAVGCWGGAGSGCWGGAGEAGRANGVRVGIGREANGWGVEWINRGEKTKMWAYEDLRWGRAGEGRSRKGTWRREKAGGGGSEEEISLVKKCAKQRDM